MVTQWLALALSLLLCLRSADFMPAAGMLRSFDRCSFAELQEHFEAMLWPETSANMCPIRSPFCFSFSVPCQMLCLQRSPAADVVLIAMLGEDRAGALGWLELARCAGLLAGAVSRRRRYMMCCARTMDLANRHRQTIEARYGPLSEWPAVPADFAAQTEALVHAARVERALPPDPCRHAASIDIFADPLDFLALATDQEQN